MLRRWSASACSTQRANCAAERDRFIKEYSVHEAPVQTLARFAEHVPKLNARL
jgi:hypothetical protein